MTPTPAPPPGSPAPAPHDPSGRPEAELAVDVGALGTIMRIQTPDAECAAVVRRAWHLALHSGQRVDVPEDRLVHMQVGDGGDDDRSERRSRAMVALTQALTRGALRAQAGKAVFLHAGGLCNPRTGASFVYVAPGGTGKTTLTRTLGPTFAYLSDETIAVTADGAILPYLKPLSVRRGGHGSVKDEVAPGELGLMAPTVTPWLAGLVVLRRAEGPQLRIERVGTLDAIAALSPETSAVAALDSPLRRVADVVERAGGLRVVTYGEAADLESLVGEVLEGTR